MLYQITHPSTSKISYVFGTMHVSTKEAFTYYGVACEAIKQSQCFAAEIDFSDPGIASMSSLFYMKGLTRISDHIGRNKWSKMCKQIQKSFEVDLNVYDRMLPMFAVNQILSGLLPNDRDQPLDHALYQFALERQVRVDGLESLERQYDIVNQLDLKTQLVQIKSLSRNPNKSRQKIFRLNRLYAEGDIKMLYHLGRRSLGRFRNVLLVERNILMTTKMIQIMEDESIFAAVGVAHLYGQKGMLKLLKEGGYTVKKALD